MNESAEVRHEATAPSAVRPAVIAVLVLVLVLVAAFLVVRAVPAIVDGWSGTTEGPEGAIPVSVEFHEGGRMSGNDGCNVFAGAWSLTRDGAVVDRLESTLMFCMDVDTWLTDAQRFVVDGDRLLVYDEQGAHIGSLDRVVS